ncbi:hypothetical protein [Enterovirga aerilata]|uniref:Uncharacterized protein n=1 Tax=Enterovirga aerilata TaxID=2730920 RepID=A0A849I092_9HYPH|nr:hypothetical protein [Enterovirga sp. DB1703]NNM73176.1 hypothetical protein [Enterovirga sp. DB1703]
MTSQPKVLIGTTTANGVVASDYVMSLMRMTDDLRARGVRTELRLIDGPNLMVQRDVLARELLNSDASHLLLIGSSMRFPADLCARLLASGKPVVGAIHPRGGVDLERLGASVGVLPFEAAVARAHDWHVELLDRTIRVQDGFCEVRAVGPGFLLIAREAIARLAEGGRLPRYEFPAGKVVLTAFFRYFFGDDPPSDPEHAFCRRWRESGGAVWGFAAAPVGPVAEVHYGLPFSRMIAASSEPAPTGRDGGAV